LTSPASARPESSTQDFRFFLQEELLRRCKKNPRFSLRAFARTLDVEASSLSKILNGKRTLTKKMLHRLCSQLGLGPDQVQEFEERLPPAPAGRQGATAGMPIAREDYQQVSADIFNVIADWYHYAILELITVRGFEPTPAWIARVLDVTVSEANFAVERLRRLGLLTTREDGSWEAGRLSTNADGGEVTAAAFRKLQRQILAQAVEAMENVPIAERDQSSITMAVSKRRLGEAKAKIRAFRRELCEFLQDDASHDDVYQLSISLFPVTKMNNGAIPARDGGQHA
jgi:uncharacterized protein (TIGR02147 family)